MALRAESLTARHTRRDPVEVEKSLDQLSFLMDGLFRIPGVGWRFGLDAMIGLVPGIGDTATTVVSIYILTAAVRYRVPKITLLRMGLNIGIDYLLGVVLAEAGRKDEATSVFRQARDLDPGSSVGLLTVEALKTLETR